MPYRFKTHEPVEKGFRRIAREQLDAALAELAGVAVGPKNVHECRKSLKRLRSLVRLSADAIGDDKARQRNKALGEIARLLSARRDRTVMLETISKLSNDVANAAASLAPLKLALTAETPDEPETLDPDIARRAQHLLEREAAKFAKMPFGKRGFAALSRGLTESYRKGRKASKYAYEEPTDENFHDLRKAVQWHWRQMSLLSKAWPDEFAVRAHAARELSQLLGDDHDLAVLIAAAGKSPAMTDEQKDAAVTLCRQQQQLLRATAEYRAKRLFAEKSDAFVGRVASYWRCSRSIDPQLEVQPASGQVGAQDEAAPVAAKVRDPAPELRPAPAKPRMAAKDETRAPSQRRA
ncbi:MULTISPECIES: CHAD domain-containing protein [unclassified Hyphomicrobium]|uniref:CHAD domain-containing protein n=1 Tax=unclassified Hyphomicrobium TaxID=2619925 RepID=UPI000213E3AF|nr:MULTISPECIES: CHAD domain-containing protein [unclassified Hyphomicrobium]CCB63968.1 CHAD domain containing protein [Hyphomicrobium sp. MC1]